MSAGDPGADVGSSLPRYFGPYTLFDVLGRGASATAYLGRARDPETAKHLPDPLVIKVLHEHHANNESARSRFQHECEMAVMLNSPHIARVYDVGRVGGDWFLAMEFVRGWRLSEYLRSLARQSKRPVLEDTLAVFSGLLAGLHALHEARHSKTDQRLDAVHRDVSPANVMLAKDAHACLIDLGLGNSALKEWNTRTGTLMGTPGYMAPEVVRAEGADHRSDTYAAAIVCYELVTVGRYIKGKRLSEVLRASADPVFIPPSAVDSSLPSDLDDVLQRALSPKPDNRFQSATEFAQALVSVSRTSPDQTRMEAFMKKLLPPANDANLSAMLSVELPPDEPEEQATELWVRRRELAPEVVAAGLMSPVEAFSVQDSGPSSDSEPLVVPISSPSVTPYGEAAFVQVRRGSSLPLGIAAFGALVAVVGVAAWVSGSKPAQPAPLQEMTTPVASPRKEPTTTPSLRPTVRATAGTPEEPPPPLPAAPPANRITKVDEPRRPRNAVVERPRQVRKQPPVATDQRTPQLRLRERGKALLARGASVRRAHPEHAAAIDVLMTDVSMELASRDAERALRRLDGIAEKLSKLETQ